MGTDDLGWMVRAACRDVDTSLFFPGPGESLEPARAFCRACGVCEECLTYALDYSLGFGVWGGLSDRERRRVKRMRRAVA